jgi:hypothetical protein
VALPENIDEEKLAEVALAVLWLTAHGDNDYMRAWKGLDWDVLALLHERGWINDPVGKKKSVIFSREGAELADRYFEKHFGTKSE